VISWFPKFAFQFQLVPLRRGVGFADFADDENLDKAALMNGKPLMGRPIRMDWQAPKNRQD
jgi:hypothetical protein